MITFKNEQEYEYISIENLKNKSKKVDDEKIFKYVVNLIKFIGNLCLGNNILAVEGFKTIYQLDTCIRIITNSVLSSQLRASFAHLIHHMWFKSGEQNQFRKTQFFCKVWDNIDVEYSYLADTEEILLVLWEYIQNYLNDILRTWQFEMFGKTDFEFLNSLLQLTTDLLLDNVLNQKDINDLRKTLQEMLFCNPKDTGISENIKGGLTACKTLLIDTIKVILTFDFNQFVQSLLKQVKKGMFLKPSDLGQPNQANAKDINESLLPSLHSDGDMDLNHPSQRRSQRTARNTQFKDRLIRGVSRQ